MALSFDNHTTGGVVFGDLTFGYAPIEWMMFTIKRFAVLWDSHGNRSSVQVSTRVVVQGKRNVASLRNVIHEGSEVMAHGQDVPAYTVAADSHNRGPVLLAAVVQTTEPFKKEDS
jgi:hypothetical protein